MKEEHWNNKEPLESKQPLAASLRPKCLDEFIGQEHILSTGKPLFEAILSGSAHSMILWGPPGTGKTTLAKIIAAAANANIEMLSAVLAGVKDIRAVMQRAQQAKAAGTATILFVDEVHRFNKSQQDAFLPYVEDGTVTFIGATTENPSFELNNALLSRARVYILKSLTEENLQIIISNATESHHESLPLEPAALKLLARAADGDARRALNFLEIAWQLAATETQTIITIELLQAVLTAGVRRFDKGGDDFYDQISALHKSVRGSDPDAALYWLCRMLDGGCDPIYIARRVIRMATEDIGNADPRALTIALNAWEAYERLGSPEGELVLAQAVVYCAVAAKSNAAYTAFKTAMQAAKQNGSLPVPMHLRNAPTKLMQELGHGKNYRYAHDEANGYAKGEKYFPDQMQPTTYYQPVARGLEIKIKQKLDTLKNANSN